MFTRGLAARLGASKKSFLLLGPRQTGKSTLIAGLRPTLTINLAHEATYLDFARNPRELEERLGPLATGHVSPTVFIDEVQRLPSVLNTLQTLLDRPGNRLRFFLTGSSARKLRRGGANLLPGRIHTYHLGPMTALELEYRLETRQVLATGTLPGILSDSDRGSREKTLRSYAGTYLKEEIQAESLSRNPEGFARVLGVVAEWAGRHLDLSKIAQAAQVPRQTAVRYFEILEDTLVVQRAEPFTKSLSRRLVQHPKFYFFDVGVRNGLLGAFDVSADRIAALFEHMVFTQITASAAALDIDVRVSSYRTEHGSEVDLIVETGRDLYALELKASRHVAAGDLRGLRVRRRSRQAASPGAVSDRRARWDRCPALCSGVCERWALTTSLRGGNLAASTLAYRARCHRAAGHVALQTPLTIVSVNLTAARRLPQKFALPASTAPFSTFHWSSGLPAVPVSTFPSASDYHHAVGIALSAVRAPSGTCLPICL